MKTHYHCDGKNHKSKHIILGLLLIAAGVFFILKNLGILSPFASSIIFSWQMLLIAIGLTWVANHKRTPGIILIIIGAAYLAPEFFNLPINFHEIFWPSLLILGGILMIFSRGRHFAHRHAYTINNGTDDYLGYGTEDYIDVVLVFSGSERNITSQNFKGGSIVTVFGGSKIDLTHAALADGINYLEVVCAFGGVELYIPSDWNVKIEVISALGGFSDKRMMINPTVDTNKTLIIKGVAAFGGGEIKSAKR